MEQLIELVIVFALGWWLGAKVTTFFHVAAFKKILEELGVSNDQLRKLGLRVARDLGVTPPSDLNQPEDGLEVIHIKLEQHQGQIYAFRKDNDGFLGQGTDRDSLIQHLKQRMNNVRLIIDEGGDLLQKNNNQNG